MKFSRKLPRRFLKSKPKKKKKKDRQSNCLQLMYLHIPSVFDTIVLDGSTTQQLVRTRIQFKGRYTVVHQVVLYTSDDVY